MHKQLLGQSAVYYVVFSARMLDKMITHVITHAKSAVIGGGSLSVHQA